MDSFAGGHDMAFHIKEEVMSVVIKAENMAFEDCEQQPEYYDSSMDTFDPNLYIKPEEVNVKLEENYCESIDQSLLPGVVKHDIEDTEEEYFTQNEIALHTAAPQSEIVKCATSKSTGKKKHMCQVCTYRTRYTDNLKLHMLSHDNLSEVKLFKCDLCSYQTRYNSNKTKHMLIHMSSSDVPMHKCELCSFESKYKVNLAKHMWSHKDAREYKCDLCAFRTKRKGGLVEHTLIHKSSAEVTMYSCAQCHFQTKHKRNLARHMMVHKTRAE